MSYKTKLKIKKLLYEMLGFLTMMLILGISYISNKIFEMIIVISCFYLFRNMFDKQYHSKSLINCSLVSIVVFSILSHIVVDLSISILCSAILSFVTTDISYLVRDYIDNKILIKELKKNENKCLENLTEKEMIELFPKIKYDVIHLVYGYMHRENGITCIMYAYQNNISEATMYRYLKMIKENYERFLNKG